jgi:hypothetical protein
MEQNRRTSTVCRPGTVSLCNNKLAELAETASWRSSPRSRGRGLARAIVVALGHRGGADSSVDFDPCQDPFFPATKPDFRGIFFSDLHGIHPASRPILSFRPTARHSDSIGIASGVREDCAGRDATVHTTVALRHFGHIVPGRNAQHRLSRHNLRRKRAKSRTLAPNYCGQWIYGRNVRADCVTESSFVIERITALAQNRPNEY